jgi:hypothetical protein
LAFRSQDAAAAKAAETLRAKGFVLVDDAGKPRAELAMVKGHPSLALLDVDGTRRAHLSLLDGTQPSLMITDDKGANRISFMVDAMGHPHLLMADPGQKPRVHMAVSERGAGSLMFIHLDGTMPAGIGLHADGRAWVRSGADAAKDQKPATRPAEVAPEKPVAPEKGKDEPK